MKDLPIVHPQCDTSEMRWVFLCSILILACAPPIGPEPLPYRFSLDILDSPDPLADDPRPPQSTPGIDYFARATNHLGKRYAGPTAKIALMSALSGRQLTAAMLKGEGLAINPRNASAGDLVFFNDTQDANGNGKRDDALSEVGFVVDVRGSRLRFVYLHAQRARLGTLNLRRPSRRRRFRRGRTGPVENTYLRPIKKGESLRMPRLAGQLLAGFAALP